MSVPVSRIHGLFCEKQCGKFLALALSVNCTQFLSITIIEAEGNASVSLF